MHKIVMGHRSFSFCLQCGLRDLSSKKIPLVASWIHGIPRYMHAFFFLTSSGAYAHAFKFPEAGSTSSFLTLSL